MDRLEYLRDENWYGSFYEISLELGPTGNDTIAIQALRALWAQPEVRGHWRERLDFGYELDDAAITIDVDDDAFLFRQRGEGRFPRCSQASCA